MIFSHNNPFGFLQDLTPLRSVSLPHPYVWDAMRGGWTSYYTSSLVCILFSGSARWLNFHQNLAKFHLEMNSFTSQTTDESRLKSFRFFSQICPEMISKFFSRFEWHGASCMACSRPVVATRIMWSIRNCHLVIFSYRGPLERNTTHSHSKSPLYSVSIEGSS